MYRKGNIGPRNGFWRGGRSIASNGYVLIRVGTDHHLADVRGYAYEHRLVAEKKIGRRLLPGELVHHIDENKKNNDPINLEVMKSTAHHFKKHRKLFSGRREPDEPNVIIECECGCGTKMDKYDELGRPRSFISGHNPIPSPTQDNIMQILANGRASLHEIREMLGKSKSSISMAMQHLKKKGLVVVVGWGVYKRKDMSA